MGYGGPPLVSLMFILKVKKKENEKRKETKSSGKYKKLEIETFNAQGFYYFLFSWILAFKINPSWARRKIYSLVQDGLEKSAFLPKWGKVSTSVQEQRNDSFFEQSDRKFQQTWLIWSHRIQGQGVLR